MLIKKIYKKILYAYKSDSKSYVKFLKKNGVIIGNNVTFYEPNTNYIDIQKGFLIKIGNNVEVTRGVTIITHDYSWSIYKKNYGEIIGSRENVEIGNNVFIGINSTIMPGVKIGDNVIIGANSVVTKDLNSNTVYCGNPAKEIKKIDDLYEVRKSAYKDEAVNMFITYFNRYNKIPPKEIFDEFFWLFEERNMNNLSHKFIEKMKLTGNFEETKKAFLGSKPLYNDYSDFCDFCLKKCNDDNAL